MQRITVVIPTRKKERATLTLNSLPKGIKTIIIGDRNKGANWARNKGFKKVKTEFVLFSDNDINWRPGAIQSLLDTLLKYPEASYSYGAYEMGGQIQCDREFDQQALKMMNYISTMSLIRTKDFPGFDNKIERLQDWDLWLTMLEQGKTGVYCGEVIFDTPVRDGISQNGRIGFDEAYEIIMDKHI